MGNWPLGQRSERYVPVFAGVPTSFFAPIPPGADKPRRGVKPIEPDF